MGLFGDKKIDVVIVAVRLEEAGRIEWLRGFVRRGPTWSDYKKIPRAEAIERIRSGQKFFTGERIPYQAGTFNTYEQIRIVERGGENFLVSGSDNGLGDSLARVPIL